MVEGPALRRSERRKTVETNSVTTARLGGSHWSIVPGRNTKGSANAGSNLSYAPEASAASLDVDIVVVERATLGCKKGSST